MATRADTQAARGDGPLGHGAGLRRRATRNGHTAAAPDSTAGLGSGFEIEAPRVAIPAPLPAHDGAVAALTTRLKRMAGEAVSLTQRIEELESELERRTRRLHQLLGERDQLQALLGRRDNELQRVNREVGALSALAEPGQVRLPALWAALRQLLDGMGRARKVSRPAKPAAPQAQPSDARVGAARLVPWVKDRPPKDIVAVVVFGLSEAEIDRVLELVERYCAEHETAPLLLTDNDSFQLFRNRRVVFEFLPPRSEQQRLAPDLDWQLFTLRRLALIRRKWRPVRVVSFGRQAADVVRLWRDSPFEDAPLPATPSSKCGLAPGRALHSVAA
jgi:hypothetical protein